MSDEPQVPEGAPKQETTAVPGTEPQQLVVPATPKPPLVAGGKVTPIIPQTIEEVGRIASAVIRGNLAPDSYKKAERGVDLPDEDVKARIMIGIMKGAEVGLPPITALSWIAIINGRPCVWGDGAMALIQKSGKVEWIREFEEGEHGKDDWTAVCRIKRRDQDEPYEGRFSITDAKRAGLLGKKPWQQYPQRMLRWRAASWAMRDGFADVLSGLSIAEEVRDLPAEPEQVDLAILEDEDEAATLPALGEPEAAAEPEPEPEPEIVEEAEVEESTPEEPEVEAAEPEPESLAERYRVQMFGAISECADIENLNALKASFDQHKVDFDDPESIAVIKRIENRFAVRQSELG